MGYLLPIQPIQSQQYANRMNMESYNFAYIDRVEKIEVLILKGFLRNSNNHSMHDAREKGEEVIEIPIVSAPTSNI